MIRRRSTILESLQIDFFPVARKLLLQETVSQNSEFKARIVHLRAKELKLSYLLTEPIEAPPRIAGTEARVTVSKVAFAAWPAATLRRERGFCGMKSNNRYFRYLLKTPTGPFIVYS